MRRPVRGGLTGIALVVLALCAWVASARSPATVFSFSSQPYAPLAPPPDGAADGLPDDWETQNGLDPASPAGALLDFDGDGLGALDEYRAGLDPWRADSDGDGFADGAPPGSDPPANWAADVQNRAALRLHQAP